MQIKLFNIPISDNGEAAEEMNRFLRSHKILELEQNLINNENGAVWCFCARYILNTSANSFVTKTKIDYKNLLDEKTFKIFSFLREGRKSIAKEEGVPAYAVFTDEELAGIARLEQLDLSMIRSVKGIGEKKTERYGKSLLDYFQKHVNPLIAFTEYGNGKGFRKKVLLKLNGQ